MHAPPRPHSPGDWLEPKPHLPSAISASLRFVYDPNVDFLFKWNVCAVELFAQRFAKGINRLGLLLRVVWARHL